ncbi:hypothetical protein [Pseudaestuariivita sp.]|uniref:hypothetical protein n=1 Tax=Pseudaestuariivita sp. TaxID=2211669 RepID=UPI0040584D4A
MRSYYRKKLNKLLEAAGDEEFIQLLWATHMLQSETPDVGRKYFDPQTIPDGATNAEFADPLSIKPWEIETLANELMTVPKVKPRKSGKVRSLRCDHFRSSLNCARWLRELENAEFSIQKKRQDIFIEMGRIAARQFDWQRGYVNIPQFYRNAFVCGQGECARYFSSTHGISFNRFSQIGFMLFVSLMNFPVVRNDNSWAKLEVEWEEVEKVLALIALPFPVAAKLARARRRSVIHTADKPSILRQAPCLRFGENGERVRAPLPELILERVTSGVFYDVVGGGGPIRDYYGRRFEDYCCKHLSEALEGPEWKPEFSYRKKPQTFVSPDILCMVNGQLDIALECKATRMSQEAMFGKDPHVARGYEDMTKAVFQLWRFFSHCRRGVTGFDLRDDAVGVVLTLDNCLTMAESLRLEVLEDAETMAKQKEPEITAQDRRPITFVAIPELARVLSVATPTTFKEALIEIHSDERMGWRLDALFLTLRAIALQKRGVIATPMI